MKLLVPLDVIPSFLSSSSESSPKARFLGYIYVKNRLLTDLSQLANFYFGKDSSEVHTYRRNFYSKKKEKPTFESWVMCMNKFLLVYKIYEKFSLTRSLTYVDTLRSLKRISTFPYAMIIQKLRGKIKDEMIK